MQPPVSLNGAPGGDGSPCGGVLVVRGKSRNSASLPYCSVPTPLNIIICYVIVIVIVTAVSSNCHIDVDHR